MWIRDRYISLVTRSSQGLDGWLKTLLEGKVINRLWKRPGLERQEGCVLYKNQLLIVTT